MVLIVKKLINVVLIVIVYTNFVYNSVKSMSTSSTSEEEEVLITQTQTQNNLNSIKPMTPMTPIIRSLDFRDERTLYETINERLNFERPRSKQSSKQKFLTRLKHDIHYIQKETKLHITTSYQELLNNTLIYAIEQGNAPCVLALLFLDASVNACDRHNSTALHYATWKGIDAIVSLLLKARADTSIQNLLGDTALHIATQRKRLSTIQILLDIKTYHDIKMMSPSAFLANYFKR